MAKISQYSSGGSPESSDLFIVARSGSNVRLLYSAIVSALTLAFNALYAPVANGVSNGDSHDHSVGDGAQIPTGGIVDDAVKNAKLANMATQTFKGRTTAGTGDPEDLTVAQAQALLIPNDTITNAILANMATQTFKGRTTAGTGDPEDLTVAQARALLLEAETTWTPTFTNLTVGNGTLAAYYKVLGKLVIATIDLTFGSTTSVSGDVSVDVPYSTMNGIALSPVGIAIFRDTGTAQYSGVVYRNAANSAVIRVLNVSGTYATQTALSSAVPHTWAATDQLMVQIIYFTP